MNFADDEQSENPSVNSERSTHMKVVGVDDKLYARYRTCFKHLCQPGRLGSFPRLLPGFRCSDVLEQIREILGREALLEPFGHE